MGTITGNTSLEAHKQLFGKPSELRINDWMYEELSYNLAICCNYICVSIGKYLGIIKKVADEIIVEGEIHEVFLEYIEMFEGIKEKYGEIGEQYKVLIKQFISDVDVIDGFVYQKSCSKNLTRDFSDDKLYDIQASLRNLNGGNFEFLNDFFSIANRGVAELGVFFDRGKQASSSYIASLAAYHDTTKEKISEIFSNVRTLDSSYGKRIEELNNAVEELYKIVEVAKELIKSRDGLTKGAVSKLNRRVSAVVICTESLSETEELIKEAKEDERNRDENDLIKNIGDTFRSLDNAYELIPEPYRNLLESFAIDEIKIGEVSVKDVYEVVGDFFKGEASWSTVKDTVSIFIDATADKSTFVQALKATIGVAPIYVGKSKEIDEKIDVYLNDGKYIEALYSAFIGNGTVITQGVVDGMCGIIDKTFHLSDVSDAIEIVTGGHINIGKVLNDTGQRISDSVDYYINPDNFEDIGRYYIEFTDNVTNSDLISYVATSTIDQVKTIWDDTTGWFFEMF